MTLALRIKFTPTYPEEVPELSIETLDGSIETDEHEKLYSELMNVVCLLVYILYLFFFLNFK